MTDFVTRYAASWSSRNPEEPASFQAEHGSLTVHDGEPVVGREAIAAKARGLMEALPVMVVTMDSVSREGDAAAFHRTRAGTNSGLGGTGRSVRISGYEEWTLTTDNLSAESKGTTTRRNTGT